MRTLTRWLLIVVFLIGTQAPAATAEDPWSTDGGVSAFYSWTERLPKTPGKILRTEPLEKNLLPPNASAGFRILYSSTDGLDGKTPVTVSGYLLLPRGERPKDGWPLIAWAHGTVGVADVCAPSWTGRFAAGFSDDWLAKGHAFVASDYQGLGTPGNHPYLATRPAAYSVLDGIRAAHDAKLNLAKKIVVIGQSQGAAAAFATVAYAKSYAPELDIRGAVATGIPYLSNEVREKVITQRPAETVDPTFAYTLLMLYLAKQTEPTFRFEDYLTDAAVPNVRLGASACAAQVMQSITRTQLTYASSFKKDVTPSLNKVFDLMDYPTLKIKPPLFVGTGGRDVDTPSLMQSILVKDACAAKTKVEWHVYPELNHGRTFAESLSDVQVFVSKAFADESLPGNCGKVSLPAPAPQSAALLFSPSKEGESSFPRITVKPSTSSGMVFVTCRGIDAPKLAPGPSPLTVEPGQCAFRGVPTNLLLLTVFRLTGSTFIPQDQMVENMPDSRTTYDIDIVDDPATATAARLWETTSKLVGDIFKIKSHREMREAQGYVLTTANGGTKLKPANPNAAQLMSPPGSGTFVIPSASMPMLLTQLATRLRAPIQDNTNLTGSYEIALKWTPGANEFGPGMALNGRPMPATFLPPGTTPPDPNGPTLFAALEEQLGLRLEPRSLKYEVTVIDNIEPPKF